MIFKKTSNTLRQDRNNNSKWTSYILYVYGYTHICWLYTTRKLSMKHVPPKKWIIDIAQFIGCILRSHPYSTTHGSKKTTILYPFHGHWLFIYTHVLNNYPNLLGQTPMWISWIGRFQVWCLIPMCFMVSSSFILCFVLNPHLSSFSSVHFRTSATSLWAVRKYRALKLWPWAKRWMWLSCRGNS